MTTLEQAHYSRTVRKYRKHFGEDLYMYLMSRVHSSMEEKRFAVLTAILQLNDARCWLEAPDGSYVQPSEAQMKERDLIYARIMNNLLITVGWTLDEYPPERCEWLLQEADKLLDVYKYSLLPEIVNLLRNDITKAREVTITLDPAEIEEVLVRWQIVRQGLNPEKVIERETIPHKHVNFKIETVFGR